MHTHPYVIEGASPTVPSHAAIEELLLRTGASSLRQDVPTDDALEILRYAADAVAAGIPAALVTLVDVHGGAARQPGAQMVVLGDGRYCGFVSGGCIETAAAREALEAVACKQDRVVRFGQSSPYFDIVLPCGGGITLAIHVLRDGVPLQNTLARLNRRQPAALVYDPHLSSLASSRSSVVTGWAGGRFHRAFVPRPRLVIFGGSLEASSIAALAHVAGYEIALGGDVMQGPMIDEFTAVALLFHDVDREIGPLRAALNANPFYVGALGSTRTHEKRVRALLDLGYSAANIAKIKAPIGLFAKARDASSLALSVLADVAVAWQQRTSVPFGHTTEEDAPLQPALAFSVSEQGTVEA